MDCHCLPVSLGALMIQTKKGPITVDGRKYPRFTVIYNRELLTPEVKKMRDATLRVWLLLNMTCNKVQDGDERSYWCSYARLAECSGRSRSTVYRALGELRDLGMITTTAAQGASVITLYKPPSLTGRTEETMQKSQDWHSGSVTQDDTPGSSPGDTCTSTRNISSTSVPVPLPHINPKDTWKNVGGSFGPKYKTQAITEEHCAEMCEGWRSLLEMSRGFNEYGLRELATLCRNQPNHFVAAMGDRINANEDLLRMMMKVPGFYQQLFGKD